MQTLLYITYTNFNNIDAGSAVRPFKLYEALKKTGIKIYLISNTTERRQQINEAMNWLDHNKPDFCYIEPPSEMIFTKQDWALFKKVHELGIATAFFYRDFFYKFPLKMFFAKQPKFVQFKTFIKYKIQNLTEKKLAKYVDLFYFPSNRAADLFFYKNKKVLPPAGESLYLELDNTRLDNTTYIPNAIYVGGISEGYGTNFLIDSFKIINQDTLRCNLQFVCREAEYLSSFLKDISYPWLKIIHAQGSDLANYYRQSDIAVLPINCWNPYHNLAVSVKLFEYISYGLPIVSTPTLSMSEIVNKYQLGLVTSNYSSAEFAKNVLELVYDRDKYKNYRNNVIHALETENLWIHRAKQIIDNLGNITILKEKE